MCSEIVSVMLCVLEYAESVLEAYQKCYGSMSVCGSVLVVCSKCVGRARKVCWESVGVKSDSSEWRKETWW